MNPVCFRHKLHFNLCSYFSLFHSARTEAVAVPVRDAARSQGQPDQRRAERRGRIHDLAQALWPSLHPTQCSTQTRLAQGHKRGKSCKDTEMLKGSKAVWNINLCFLVLKQPVRFSFNQRIKQKNVYFLFIQEKLKYEAEAKTSKVAWEKKMANTQRKWVEAFLLKWDWCSVQGNIGFRIASLFQSSVNSILLHCPAVSSRGWMESPRTFPRLQLISLRMCLCVRAWRERKSSSTSGDSTKLTSAPAATGRNWCSNSRMTGGHWNLNPTRAYAMLGKSAIILLFQWWLFFWSFS